MQTYFMDTDAVLDFKFDFAPLTNGEAGADSDWLESGETIASHTVTVDATVTNDSDSLTDGNTSVTVWLSAPEVGIKSRINCEIVTSSGRTEQRSFMVKGVNK